VECRVSVRPRAGPQIHSLNVVSLFGRRPDVWVVWGWGDGGWNVVDCKTCPRLDSVRPRAGPSYTFFECSVSVYVRAAALLRSSDVVDCKDVYTS
jgi:hypothetical protein